MPRKEDNQRNSQFSQITTEQNQTPTNMEIEPENVNQISKENQSQIDNVPDLTGIEDEIIEDSRKSIKYNPESFEKCFVPQDENSKVIASIALKFYLSKRKYPDRNVKNNNPKPKVAYILNKSWYLKWKDFSRYRTIKRAIKTPEFYSGKPINFIQQPDKYPGIINNSELLIRNKINDEERNILVSDYNDCIDTKLEYKKDFILLPKERFDLLNKFFKCDCIIKAPKIENNESKNYNAFSAHFKIIFLPTLAVFKNINEENIEEFKKNHNIIYDIYFKQGSTGKDIFIELKYILFKKPEILSNMGIELTNQSDIKEIQDHLNKFQFYLPSNKNTKNTKEMVDYIFSNETIELIKKDEKIKEKDISITRVGYIFDLNSLFHLNWLNNKKNLDEVERGTIFVEYINLELPEEKRLASIFDIKFEETIVRTFYEPTIQSVSETTVSSMENYDLDNFTLNKEKNQHGLVGLNNLGNTCYMNTGLQCLSNCELLTKYFLGDYYKDFINKENPIGSQGEIVEKYSQLIHHLWQGDKDCISPIQFKKAFGKLYNAFKDYRQQDSQEFISYLLDSLHEDLNKVKSKPYIDTKNIPLNLTDEDQFKIEKDFYLCRNQSFIVDLIYGFYKSTVFCPDEKCNHISKSFEPFNMITLSLVNEAQIRKLQEYQEEKNKKLGIKIITVTFIPFKINLKPLKFPVKVKKEMNINEFKNKIEKITGFNKNSFEIYKMQSTEFVPIKPNIILLEDFLKGEKKLYLFQIPPYVFGKSSDYFDKVYEELNNDHDKLYLEEEKYEGNDLYKEYNKKQKKCRTDDDLHLENNPNRINIIIDNKEEERKENRIKDDDDVEMKDAQMKDIETKDIEMKDESLTFDKKEWIKAEFYNYSYSKEKNKENINEEYRINNSRIIYLNREIDNSSVYLYISEMLEGVRSDLDEIKAAWFSDLQEVTKEMSKKDKKKKSNIYDYFDDIPHHPLFLQYLGFFNFNKNNIMKKKEGWKNNIFISDPEEHTVEKEVLKALENNEIEDIELLFKIVWKPVFSEDYNEGTTSIEIEKSEKLEEIFRNQRENEIINKNIKENVKEKEKEGKKKNKKLKLEDLFHNFNEKEKLSKDNEWYCPKCKQFQLADKKMEIYSANEIVIIHLKRFRNNRKIENLVEFPLEGLNLKEYLPKKEDRIYDLFAVANHNGGLQGGHYFAYCKNYLDNEWYEFNDSNVSKIEKSRVVSDSAYVLFYNRRKEAKINEEELFKKPFIEIDFSKYISKSKN